MAHRFTVLTTVSNMTSRLDLLFVAVITAMILVTRTAAANDCTGLIIFIPNVGKTKLSF